MSSKTQILFLDIDSVLNCAEYASSIYDGTSSILVAEKVPLYKQNVEELKHILSELPKLKIVWASDWRLSNDEYWNGWRNPRLWLEEQEWMKDRVISKTPKKMSSTHPEEIHLWFKENDFNKKHEDATWMKDKWCDVSDYAILDDWNDNLMQKFGKHLFTTTYDKGLTKEIADSLIAAIKNGSCTYSKEELDWKGKKT